MKFIPNDNAFYMMCGTSVRILSVEFLDTALYIYRLKIARPVFEGHLKNLKIATAKYQLKENFVVPITVNKGTMDTLIDNVHNVQLPKSAFVAFVDHNAFNRSENLNSFNYQHFNFNYLAFYLNGKQYSEKAFTPDFSKGLYVKEYLSLFEATNQDTIDNCFS